MNTMCLILFEFDKKTNIALLLTYYTFIRIIKTYST